MLQVWGYCPYTFGFTRASDDKDNRPHTFFVSIRSRGGHGFNKNQPISMGECLYIPFWKKQLPFIKETITSGRTRSKELDIAQLQACSREGNRRTLRFRISIEHGIAATNTNSAIARDLCEVLNSSDEIAEIAKDKKVVIHLVKGNQLEVEVE